MSKLGTSRSSLTDGLDISPKGGGKASGGARGSGGTDTMKLVKIGVIVVCFLGVGYVMYSQFFAGPSVPEPAAGTVQPRPANAKPSARSMVGKPTPGEKSSN